MSNGAQQRAVARTVAEWKRDTGAVLDEQVIVDELENLRREGWLGHGSAGLTSADAEYLEREGGVSEHRGALRRVRIATALHEDLTAKESLHIDQVAQLMGISASRVRHRLKDGTLYAYPTGGRGVARVLPSWQFSGSSPTPHLASVLDALPDRFRPSDIRAFALNGTVDDPLGSDPVTLLDWLRGGGDPSVARDLAESESWML